MEVLPQPDSHPYYKKLIEVLGGTCEERETKLKLSNRGLILAKKTYKEKCQMEEELVRLKKITSESYNLKKSIKEKDITIRKIENENKSCVEDLRNAENEIYRLKRMVDELNFRINNFRNNESENYILKGKVSGLEYEVSNRNGMIRTFYNYVSNSQSFEALREVEELMKFIREQPQHYAF